MSSPLIDVRAVARLARLELTDEEAATFGGQLERVLGHIAQLEKADISGVEPTAHASPVYNVLRDDEPVAGLDRKDYLPLAPRSANNLVVVPKVIE
ncbi:MAG: Asp-tRNA(Asn)/Glu-tRNA(Gln) amidotransferase subunit GatC [Terrimicrobiaceae bacterium]